MKSLISKLAIAIISTIALVSLVMLSADVTRKIERFQTAAISSSQPGSEILAGSYSEMMNQLNATTGR